MKAIPFMILFFLLNSYALDQTLTKAQSLIKSGHVEEGKQIIARYLTANETAQAYTSVGNLYARMKDWPNSVHYLEIASKRNEKSALIWYELGLAQHQNKQTDDAVTSLRKSLALSSKTPKTYFALGEILELARDKYDARNIYLAALSKIGSNAAVDLRSLWSKLCWLNFQDNFFKAAINYCLKATQANGADTTSWALLARTYSMNQQREEAFKVFQTVIPKFPTASLLYRVRGLIYYEDKAYEQAINDLGKAFGLDPTDDEAAIYLARSYFELGYYDRALPIYIEACKIDRDYRFEFLSKQRELSRKDHQDMASKYQEELDRF